MSERKILCSAFAGVRPAVFLLCFICSEVCKEIICSGESVRAYKRAKKAAQVSWTSLFLGTLIEWLWHVSAELGWKKQLSLHICLAGYCAASISYLSGTTDPSVRIKIKCEVKFLCCFYLCSFSPR